MSTTQWSLAQGVASTTVALDRLGSIALRISAAELARQLAPLLMLGEIEVFDCLCTVSDNMLSLLDTPEGWSALAGYVAAQLGMCSPHYCPTMH